MHMFGALTMLMLTHLVGLEGQRVQGSALLVGHDQHPALLQSQLHPALCAGRCRRPHIIADCAKGGAALHVACTREGCGVLFPVGWAQGGWMVWALRSSRVSLLECEELQVSVGTLAMLAACDTPFDANRRSDQSGIGPVEASPPAPHASAL